MKLQINATRRHDQQSWAGGLNLPRITKTSHAILVSTLVQTLCICVLTSAADVNAPPTFRVIARSSATVIGTQITLGTLLKIRPTNAELCKKLDGIVMAPAPRPGQSKKISAIEIRKRLESIGVNPPRFMISVPDELTVLRQFQTVTTEDIIEKVSREFLPRLPWKDIQVERIDLYDEIVLPVGQAEWRYQCAPQTDFAKSFYLNINFVMDGEVVKRAFLRTALRISEVVPVATNELKPSQMVRASDLLWQKQSLVSTLQHPIGSLEFFATRRPRSRILPGRVLTEDLFVNIPLVKRGESVALLYEGNRIKLTTRGKAIVAGQMGQRIQVLNPDSGKVLIAEVTGIGTARVVY